jgi:hypothetical protein
MEYITNFVIFWCILVVISMILISLRSDAKMVSEDIDMCFRGRKFIYNVAMFFMVWFILPMSIPYSLSNIFSKKK